MMIVSLFLLRHSGEGGTFGGITLIPLITLITLIQNTALQQGYALTMVGYANAVNVKKKSDSVVADMCCYKDEFLIGAIRANSSS